ncbi:unnamed protein product [Vitrella brassicaformis CCMP3155]|uniref:Uncharacterized protein n=1 Tax=Vitrella brassicaformis (strain CCMP3155) TaxID=1169540 RepID=A0A0G4EW63_VITBC|nr:unnamed protein product [Vitrella brassicaformis CCMP3155]|eukprot:CEM02483.1 unnamed protein product [Vitrella brassicaformis CCMP3155]
MARAAAGGEALAADALQAAVIAAPPSRSRVSYDETAKDLFHNTQIAIKPEVPGLKQLVGRRGMTAGSVLFLHGQTFGGVNIALYHLLAQCLVPSSLREAPMGVAVFDCALKFDCAHFSKTVQGHLDARDNQSQSQPTQTQGSAASGASLDRAASVTLQQALSGFHMTRCLDNVELLARLRELHSLMKVHRTTPQLPAHPSSTSTPSPPADVLSRYPPKLHCVRVVVITGFNSHAPIEHNSQGGIPVMRGIHNSIHAVLRDMTTEASRVVAILTQESFVKPTKMTPPAPPSPSLSSVPYTFVGPFSEAGLSDRFKSYFAHHIAADKVTCVAVGHAELEEGWDVTTYRLSEQNKGPRGLCMMVKRPSGSARDGGGGVGEACVVGINHDDMWDE